MKTRYLIKQNPDKNRWLVYFGSGPNTSRPYPDWHWITKRGTRTRRYDVRMLFKTKEDAELAAMKYLLSSK